MRLLEVTDPAALRALAAAAEHVDPAARCNAAAVEAGELHLTVPSIEALGEYAARDDHVILAVGTPKRVHGFAVVKTDGRIRWLVLDDSLSKAASLVASRMIFEECFARFGACFGRVGHEGLRDRLVEGLDEVKLDDDGLLRWRP